jgi:hypothetical protein
MQNRDMPDRGTQVFRGIRKFAQGFRNGFEEKPVQDFLIPKDERVQFIGDGKDNVKIGDGKQVFPPGLDPLLFFEKLALGTVPVSAGVVRDDFRPAVLALVHMTTLIRSAAGLDRPHDAKTIYGHGMGVPVTRTVPAEDIRNLELLAVSRVHGDLENGLRRLRCFWMIGQWA